MTELRYDAFISYSHGADATLAPALQRGLERIAKPWHRRKSLDIFRDQTNLAAAPHLWDTIVTSLQRSRWFVLLCSPAAARSRWVAREVEWWLTHRSADSLLLVLTEGLAILGRCARRLRLGDDRFAAAGAGRALPGRAASHRPALGTRPGGPDAAAQRVPR